MMMKTMMLGATILTLVTACGGATPEAQASNGAASETKPTSAPATSPEDTLGDLETKRLQDNIKANLPNHKAKFKEECGFDVDVDIDWNSFGHSKAALENLWSNYGVERLVDAFKSPCSDKAGKDAVKAKIKKLRVVNVADAAKAKAGVSGGTFTAELDWMSGHAPALSADDMATIITKAL